MDIMLGHDDDGRAIVSVSESLVNVPIRLRSIFRSDVVAVIVDVDRVS
jgi:hypothetical protein